jgi:hypothetical protein
MNSHAHEALKEHAKIANLTIGQTIENLLAAFEIRIRRMYKDLNFDKRYICRDTNRIVATAILQSDEEDWTDKELKKYVMYELLRFTTDHGRLYTWRPKIQYSKKADKE